MKEPISALLDDIEQGIDCDDATSASAALARFDVPEAARTVAMTLDMRGFRPCDVGVDGDRVTFTHRSGEATRTDPRASVDAAKGEAITLRLLLADIADRRGEARQ